MDEINFKTEINTTFDISEQERRMTAAGKTLAERMSLFAPKTIACLAVGVVALALCVIFFCLTDADHRAFTIAAIATAIVAAAALAAGIADMVIAKAKRKDAVPRLLRRLASKFGDVPSPSPVTVSMTENGATVSVGSKAADVGGEDISVLVAGDLVLIDFGAFGSLCFTREEAEEKE